MKNLEIKNSFKTSIGKNKDNKYHTNKKIYYICYV